MRDSLTIWPGVARSGLAWLRPCLARLGLAGLGKASTLRILHGCATACQGETWPGLVRLAEARRGRAGLGLVRLGWAWLAHCASSGAQKLAKPRPGGGAVGRGWSGRGMAWSGTARRGKHIALSQESATACRGQAGAGRGVAWRGAAWLGQAWPGEARRGWARLIHSRQLTPAGDSF